MRHVFVILFAAALAGLALCAPPAPPDPVSQLPPRAVPWRGLDEHASWALTQLACVVPPDRWEDAWFVSWNGVPEDKLTEFRVLFNVWVNNNTLVRKQPVIPYDVPGALGRLQYVYLSDLGWNRGARDAVVGRDKSVLEEQGVGTGSCGFLYDYAADRPTHNMLSPGAAAFFKLHKPPTVAEALRLMVKYKVPGDLAKQDRYPLGGMVWGPQLLRDLIEQRRNGPSYFDLLFAKDRFVEVKTAGQKVSRVIDWKGGDFTWPADAVEDAGKVTRNLKPGRYTYDAYEGQDVQFRFVNFPKNVAEIEKAFGVNLIRQFAKDSKIDLTTGAVVNGGDDRHGEKDASIVTLHNRLLEFVKGPTGQNARSFDVIDPVGLRDYLAQAPNLAVGEITFDAGEHLFALPNGGIAWALSDGKGDLVDVAAQLAASGQNIGKRLNVGVTTPGACFVCHAGSGGFIPPANAIQKMFDARVNLKTKDPALDLKVKNFYLGWEKEVESYQKPFHDLCHKVAGWDGAKFGTVLQDFREWYDTPLTMKQAAAELGVEVPVWEILAAKAGSRQEGSEIHLKNLVVGLTATRRTYEQDTQRLVGLLLAAQQRIHYGGVK